MLIKLKKYDISSILVNIIIEFIGYNTKYLYVNDNNKIMIYDIYSNNINKIENKIKKMQQLYYDRQIYHFNYRIFKKGLYILKNPNIKSFSFLCKNRHYIFNFQQLNNDYICIELNEYYCGAQKKKIYNLYDNIKNMGKIILCDQIIMNIFNNWL